MKTSNIILLSAFAAIIIWIVVALFTAKAMMNKLLKENPELVVNNSDGSNHKTVQLQPFHTIVINGKGHIEIKKSEGWSFDQMINDQNKIELKNDTLFMNVTGNDCNLNVNTIKNIILKDSVWVEISDFETDSFTIFSSNSSHLEINDLKIRYIGLKSMDHSKVEFNGINQPNTTANFNIRNFSTVSIDDTKGMSLTLLKDVDAQFEND
jgi:hypothetical protein